MIIIVGKVQVRRDPEALLPGAPVSMDPLSFGPGLDVGELGFSTDTGRVFIGHDPSNGNPNFARPVFPYQNVEVLTENSPRLHELFGLFLRDQDRNDFFVPTAVAVNGNNFAPLLYTEYDGALAVPARLRGASVSATIDYHAFQADSPIKQGTLRIIADAASTQIVDTDNIIKGSSAIDFQVGARQSDSEGYYFELQARNNTASPITLLIRRCVVVGMSA